MSVCLFCLCYFSCCQLGKDPRAADAYHDMRRNLIAAYDADASHAPFALSLAEHYEDHKALIQWCERTGRAADLERYKKVCWLVEVEGRVTGAEKSLNSKSLLQIYW